MIYFVVKYQLTFTFCIIVVIKVWQGLARLPDGAKSLAPAQHCSTGKLQVIIKMHEGHHISYNKKKHWKMWRMTLHKTSGELLPRLAYKSKVHFFEMSEIEQWNHNKVFRLTED